MSSNAREASRLPGFYKRTVAERRQILAERFGLSRAELEAFEPERGLCTERADQMVENGLGVLALPLGVAANFVVNGRGVCVPMAVEEPSVVAACSHIASLAAKTGGFAVEADKALMAAQVQILGPRADAAERVAASRDALLGEINALCPGLVQRGGGAKDIEVRRLPALEDDDEEMLAIHLVVDCVDAMGANALNTVAEGMAERLASLTGREAGLRILTNLADRRLARASLAIRYEDLAGDELDGRDAARDIVRAYRFAARDPYRACTHNKGVMNGIDAAAIATGNDWRAIEAAAHAYAARDGRYTSLTRFWLDDDNGLLRGSIELPMAVGVVGGSTRVHPGVRAAVKILGPFARTARDLAGLLAAVGLAQNLGALKALASEGIQRGHMRLHARQVALARSFEGDEP
jgi:hydroxymethylglutaryl-CoA reductase